MRNGTCGGGGGAGDPERILVRGVNWLGDAVMTTPALRRLRERYTGARISLLTHEKLAGLWGGHPHVDEVVVFGAGEGVWSVGRKLRRGGFDPGLALPNSHRSAVEMWLGGIPRRVGLSAPFRSWWLTQVVEPWPGLVRMRKPDVREVRRRLELGHMPPLPPVASHQAHHYLHLAGAVGADPRPVEPRLEVSASEVEAVRARFGLGDGRSWLGVNPGAEYGPAKRWPAERFVEVMRRVRQRTGCGWVVLGGKGDVGLAGELVSRLGGEAGGEVVNLAGKTSLRELCAVLRVCRVLVTNDTGPMHVAAALGVPLVAVFGSTSPELTGPGFPGVGEGGGRVRWLRERVPCGPCFLRECPVDFRCMLGVAVKAVESAVLELWSGEVMGVEERT